VFGGNGRQDSRVERAVLVYQLNGPNNNVIIIVMASELVGIIGLVYQSFSSSTYSAMHPGRDAMCYYGSLVCLPSPHLMVEMVVGMVLLLCRAAAILVFATCPYVESDSYMLVALVYLYIALHS